MNLRAIAICQHVNVGLDSFDLQRVVSEIGFTRFPASIREATVGNNNASTLYFVTAWAKVDYEITPRLVIESPSGAGESFACPPIKCGYPLALHAVDLNFVKFKEPGDHEFSLRTAHGAVLAALHFGVKEMAYKTLGKVYA